MVEIKVIEIEEITLTGGVDDDLEPECPSCRGILQWQGHRVGYVCLNCAEPHILTTEVHQCT